MKKLALIFAFVFALAGPAFADPVEGTWKATPDDNGNYGHIKISKCGAKFCGTLVKSFGPSGAALDSPNNGRKLIWDMTADGGGYYSGGKVYAPDRDKTYSSKMIMKGNTLTVKGCVMGICRTGGTWKRLN